MPLNKRVEKLEKATLGTRLLLIHVEPGQTVARALASHRRKHGPIPRTTKVVFIQHTFASTL